jgi:hypothetical protein
MPTRIRLNRDEATRMGVGPVTGRRYEDFPAACIEHGIFEPVEEFRFHPSRKWRFDFAWPESATGLEIDGGIWTRGRHGRGSGIIRDYEKMNEAACLGWRVLHFTPQQIKKDEAFEVIRRALEYGA